MITIFISNDFYSKNKIFHSISSKAKTIDTRTPFPNKIREWVKYYLKINKIDVELAFLDEIIYSNNDEICTIIGEVEKIYLANDCKKITYDSIDDVLRKSKNIRPWHLLDSIGKKDCKMSIEYIESLELGGYTVIPLIINLYNLFNAMLIYEYNSTTSSYGLNKIIASNLPRYVANYEKNEIMNIIIELKNMDILIKSTTLNHQNLISVLIIKICQGYYG